MSDKNISTNPNDRTRTLLLLIEDEGLLSRMYEKKFEVDGLDSLNATNGDEGLKFAKQYHPDLIMCDIMMPEKDGLSTLKDLKADPSTKDIPVIMLSNVSDEKYVNQALEMGAVSYLIKGNLTPADVVKEIKDKLIALGKQTLVTNKA